MTAPPAAVLPPEPPNAILAGLACRCPRCGKGRLFSGILKIAERCNACGLDLRKQDAGDGPAVFVIFFLGALFMPLVFRVEFVVAPPWWVHILLWPLPVLIVPLSSDARRVGNGVGMTGSIRGE